MRVINIITMILIIPLIISSCQEKKKRKVYFGFELGGSKKMAENNYEEFRRQNIQNNINGYPYHIHKFDGVNQYYSSPLFSFTPNDTVVHSLFVCYTIEPKELYNVIEATKSGNLGMQSYNTTSLITPNIIFEDISKDINNQYGKYDNVDTIYGNKNEIIKTWRNKNGMEITLTYTFNQMKFLELTDYYSLILKYKLTDEIKSSLKLNKSIY